jgi:methyltransferase (TIGR00027 family)
MNGRAIKPNKPDRSASVAAIVRALESNRSEKERLFNDPFSLSLLPTVFRFIFYLLRIPFLLNGLLTYWQRNYGGVMGNVVCRTCFIDDALCRSLDDNIDCLVILGAGLDSRAYRIPDVSDISVFELDHSNTLNWKKARLSWIFGKIPNHVRFLPVDFDQNHLEENQEPPVLLAQG